GRRNTTLVQPVDREEALALGGNNAGMHTQVVSPERDCFLRCFGRFAAIPCDEPRAPVPRPWNVIAFGGEPLDLTERVLGIPNPEEELDPPRVHRGHAQSRAALSLHLVQLVQREPWVRAMVSMPHCEGKARFAQRRLQREGTFV